MVEVIEALARHPWLTLFLGLVAVAVAPTVSISLPRRKS